MEVQGSTQIAILRLVDYGYKQGPIVLESGEIVPIMKAAFQPRRVRQPVSNLANGERANSRRSGPW